MKNISLRAFVCEKGEPEHNGTLTLSVSGSTLVARTTLENIQEQGVIYVPENSDDFTLETPGRVSIHFTELLMDDMLMIDTKGLTGVSIRAYMKYIDTKGKERTIYSNIIEL